MKKYLYIAIAATTLASCSQDEVMEVAEKQAISFGNAFVGNATRAATDPSYNSTSLAYFDVYGTVTNQNIYKEVRVTKNSHAYGEAWDIAAGTPSQYWVDGASYIFDAVVDATSVTTDNSTGLPTSLNYNTNTQKDMLHNRVETVGKNNTNNGIVTFKFDHLLSKVKFTVNNLTAENATNYRYTISDIEITKANLVGDCKVPEHTWTIAGNGNGSYTNIANITVASASTEECAKEVLLIPSQGEEKVGVKFNVNVEYKKDALSDFVIIKTYPKEFSNVIALVANNAYNFYIEVGLNNEIKFSAKALEDWENGNTVDTDKNGDMDIVPVDPATPAA